MNFSHIGENITAGTVSFTIDWQWRREIFQTDVARSKTDPHPQFGYLFNRNNRRCLEIL